MGLRGIKYCTVPSVPKEETGLELGLLVLGSGLGWAALPHPKPGDCKANCEQPLLFICLSFVPHQVFKVCS